MTPYRRIAHISRVKGLTGELVVQPISDLPLSVWEDLRLWVVPPDHGLIRKASVRTARQSATMRTARQSAAMPMLVLGLEGIEEATTAQRLVGRYLLARTEDLTACTAASLSEGDEGREPLLGLRMEDKVLGFIGTIVEERTGYAQGLWVIEGPYGEVLVPAVDEFFVSCDDSTVFVDLPKGLVELNR